MSIITISRQMCSYGDEIATILSNKLGWTLVTKEKILSEFLKEIASPYELNLLNESTKFFLKESKYECTFLEYAQSKLLELTSEESVVLVGFGTQIIFSQNPDALHFRIITSNSSRIKLVKKQYHVTDEEAQQILQKADKKRKNFVSKLFDSNIYEESLYHLTINTDKLSVEECVSTIMNMIKERELKAEREDIPQDSKIINNTAKVPILKNESEIEFAKILDMYNIDWQYEPKTFPIKWDPEGNITSAFSPDFYLTKFDTYIELTTMNQKYVTEKNKKIKKLRKLYPNIHVRIVYKKDFHTIIERFKEV